MEQRIVWTREIVKCLVENYKSHKCLYTPELLSYRDKIERKKLDESIKSKVLQKFPSLINLTTDDIRKKMHSLRSQFFRVKKNIDNKKLSYELRPWFYDVLSFLADVKNNDDEDSSLDNSQMDIDVDNIKVELEECNQRCRVCLIETSCCISLNDRLIIEQNDLLVSNILLTFADIKILPDDKKPQRICRSCGDDAISAYKFKLKCEQSDAILSNESIIKVPIDNIWEQDTIDTDQLKKENIEEENSEESTTNIEHYDLESFEDEYIDESIDGQIGDDEDDDTNDGKIKVDSNDEQNIHDTKDFKQNEEAIDQSTVSPNICTMCCKVFQYKSGLKAHILRHFKPKTPKSVVKCQNCDYETDNPAKLGKHLEQNHTELRNIQCTLCDKKFMRNKNLKQHMSTHTNRRNHTCEFCGNNFANTQNLKKHLLIHSGEKPFECDKCGKRFTQKASLYLHDIHVHCDDRNFHCTQCGGTFKRRSTLNAHLRTHSGIKPHKCSICNVTTRNLSSMRKHMITHTGDADYECEQCGKKFNRKSNLRVHMMSHTGEKPHVCHVCGNRFSQAHCLRSHLASQHSSEKS